MTIKVFGKGQVVLPGLLRRKLGICAGDALTAEIEGGRIVLTPQKKKARRARIISDPLTGFPVLSAGTKAPVLTSKRVRGLLADFP